MCIFCSMIYTFLSTLSLRRATNASLSLFANNSFLSTLSLRRATLSMPSGNTSSLNFYPRSPYGERRCWRWEFQHPYHFYPRSPYGERPTNVAGSPLATRSFLSTLSLRRATGQTTTKLTARYISIHALLTESDAWNRFTQRRDFISIHALLTESDLGNVEAALLMWNFYPRSPYGERRVTVLGIQHRTGISIHALLTESDLWVLMGGLSCDYFYPRSPYGERLNFPAR